MRTEYKEITIKQEVYISDDGKEFMDEDECRDYEYDLVKKQFECYDDNCKKVRDPYDAVIVNLATEDMVKKFKWWSDEVECTAEGIDKPGIYMYSCGDTWVNLDEIISKIRGAENDKT